MDKPKRQHAVVLAIVAVLSAFGAARWEVAVTADERAADLLPAIGATVETDETGSAPQHRPDAPPFAPDAGSAFDGGGADHDELTQLGASPTARLSPELAETLGAIERRDPNVTTPTNPTPADSATTSVVDAPTDQSAVALPESPTPEARGEAALASISYPWRELLPGWQIQFRPGIDEAYGYTLTDEAVIEIYVRDDQSDQLLAHVIAHELGHAVDVTLNDSADRDRWQEARGFDVQWWPDSRASDFATGAGDFAESFAAWQVGPGSFRSQLGGPPTPEQLTVLAEIVAG